MAETNLPGMFDTQYAIDRQMQEDAMAAGQLPLGGGMMYATSLAGDLANQGLMGLAGLMGGKPDPMMAKQQILQEVFEQFGNPESVEDAVAIANALQQRGLYNEAMRFNEYANQLKANMPKDERTDKIKNYEYGMALPEDKRQAYFDSINPSQVPNSYAEYIRTDATPTGAEYLAYLNNAGSNVEQTTEWRNYSNTTMNPTKEGFAIWIDRNQNIQKFKSGKELQLSILANSPQFITASAEDQKRQIDAIESEYVDIQTFTQNGVVYDAITKEAMLPGSTEKIPTVTVGGRIYDARDMTLLNDDGVVRKMVKRADDQWYYEDNGSRVFNNDVTVENPEEKAAEIYRLAGMPKNENDKVAIASSLIQAGLAGTDVFTELMKSVDKDSANAIQQENLIVKSIERLGQNYVDSGVGEMNTILLPIEQQIAQYMQRTEAADGTVIWTGDIPGWATVKRGQRLMPGEIGYQARYFAQTASTLINSVLKQRSGQAVTDPEWQRLQAEYSTGWTTSAGFASWVERIRDYTNKTEQNVIGGYQPIVVNRYFANQGRYVTLTDPENQISQIPINGYWKDTEDNIRQRKK